MTGKEAIQIMSVLTAAYPQADIKEQTIQIYLQFLTDIPYEAGKAAVLNLIGKSKWFPSVAELRQEAMQLIPGNQIPTAAEAWEEVCREIRRIGHYGIPEFSTSEIKKSVDAMGWRYLCMSENEMADRAHFMKIYDTYKERRINESLYLPETRKLLQRLNDKVVQLPERAVGNE